MFIWLILYTHTYILHIHTRVCGWNKESRTFKGVKTSGYAFEYEFKANYMSVKILL